ncbi:MAG: ThuA domain-containing protein [Acidobacteria bacterium]|nr:ThuA domain-containing protein [Acidobacteriota bacterium]
MRIAAVPLLAASLNAAQKKIVLIAGRPSHPPGSHEFNAGVTLLDKVLRQNKVFPVIVRGGWPEDPAVFQDAASIVFYMDGGERHPMLQPGRLEMLRTLAAKGAGIACLHYAVEVPKDNGGAELLSWIGGYYERPYSTNPVNDATLEPGAPAHEISRGWSGFSIRDEWYYRMRFEPTGVIPILTTMLPKNDPQREVVAWAKQRPGGGRGFGFTGGHFHRNWANPDFRRLVTNAILWTAKAKIPRGGARCDVSPDDLTTGLDPKPEPRPAQKK